MMIRNLIGEGGMGPTWTRNVLGWLLRAREHEVQHEGGAEYAEAGSGGVTALTQPPLPEILSPSPGIPERASPSLWLG